MKARFDAVFPYLLFAVGMNLMLVSLLAVPQAAFADSGSCPYSTSCGSLCDPAQGGDPNGTSCKNCLVPGCGVSNTTCQATACVCYCEGDPACSANCCKTYCGTDASCLSACAAASPGCLGFDCAKKCVGCPPTTCGFLSGSLGCCTDCTHPVNGVVLCKTVNCCNCFDSTPTALLPNCACQNNP